MVAHEADEDTESGAKGEDQAGFAQGMTPRIRDEAGGDQPPARSAQSTRPCIFAWWAVIGFE